MELSDLKQSISNLSDEALNNLFKEIRTSRRTSKVSTSAKPRTVAKAKSNKPASIESMLTTMSPEQIEALIKQMEQTK